MGYESRLIRVEDAGPDFAAAWDALPAARGRRGDFLDSHAWLAAWSQRPSRGTAAALRIPAVLANGRPVALLPLEVRSRARWESAATRAVHTHRKRYRPVLGTETPDEEAVGLLVDEAGRAGVRELSLNRPPAYERSVRRLVKRCQPWELRLEEHGGRSGAPRPPASGWTRACTSGAGRGR
jgi:hypothetical protein